MTVVTETLATVAAASQAIRTVVVIAARADLPALAAHRRLARVAAVFAVVAQIAAARVAGVDVLGRHRVAAGGTVDSVPVAELAIGRLLVVGPQYLTHEDKELADAAVLDRSCDRGLAFAFAEGDPLHVRMRVAGRSVTRIESCDPIEDLVRAQVRLCIEPGTRINDRELAAADFEPVFAGRRGDGAVEVTLGHQSLHGKRRPLAERPSEEQAAPHTRGQSLNS